METADLRIAFDVACMRTLRKSPPRVFERFHDMVLKAMSDPSRHGLNFEPIEGARDSAFRSIRIDQGYRAIGYLKGRDLLLLHVDEHDKAYRWATNKTVQFNPSLNRIQILDLGAPEPPPEVLQARPVQAPALFNGVEDHALLQLGIAEADIPRIRTIASEAELESAQQEFDGATYDILFSLAAGFAPAEIPDLIASAEAAQKDEPTFEAAIRTDESRQQYYWPEREDDLRRFLNGDLDGWRVFLHPEQRRLAYRDFGGPVLVRGGAGTGKTVVAMHRAKYLADKIAKDPAGKGDRILFTTFTATLAQDVRANLMTLCPEHLTSAEPRIEVINLDRWVGEFLRRRGFERQIVYFGDGREKLDQIWQDTLNVATIPAGLTDDFVKDEWAQVVQAKGLSSASAYASAPRSGRGTPLDRKKRLALWAVFEAFAARLIAEGLTEPDTAYREASGLIEKEQGLLPYVAVIVDETQDMGEQALRLIRAISQSGGRSPQNSLFLVGDAHQRIYARKASLAACGIEVRGRSQRLRLNYRTTDLIRRWAVGVLEGIAVDDLNDSVESLRGYRSLIKGVRPDFVSYPTRSEEIAGLAAWVEKVRVDDPTLANTAILCRAATALDAVEAALSAQSIPYLRLRNNTPDDAVREGVRLATMHRAKGLEYAHVALALLNSDEIPPRAAIKDAVDAAAKREVYERERSLLHVAATRAKRELRISWYGDRSELVVD